HRNHHHRSRGRAVRFLTLGGGGSLVSGMSPNGIVTGAADTPGRTEVRGFIWTPASGLVTIGDLGGGVTIPQGLSRGTLGGSHSNGLFVTEAGAIIGVSGVNGHRTHAF